MVGRNDPCPCGSGKKYKKCHGKEQVVDMQEVIDAEIDKVMEGFFEEGFGPKDFHQLEMRMKKWHDVLAADFDRDLIESAAFESYVYIEHSELWRNYVNRQQKKQKRRQVLDVLEAYKHPFFLLAEIAKQEGDVLTVIDSISGATHLIKSDKQSRKGDRMFGIVMSDPRLGETGLEATDSVLSISSFQDSLIQALAKELKDFKGDSLQLYQLFGQLQKELVLTPLQNEVKELVDQFAREFELDEKLIQQIVQAFLLEEPINAKKPEAIAAGILQALNGHGFFKDHYMTQGSLAKRFGVSIATLIKYRDKMEQFLADVIDQAMPEMPDLLEMMDRLSTMDLSEMQEMMEMLSITDIPEGLDTLEMDDSPFIVAHEIGTDAGRIEQKLWEAVKRVEHSEASSPEKLNRFMQKEMNAEYSPVDGKEAAQKLCYEAYETANDKRRYQLAKTAFEKDPKNADANLLMAEQELDSRERKTHYLQAIDAGYRNFDSSFEEAWGFVLNRPLLRALFAYGAWLMTQGEYKEAIEQFEEILKLNPSDHQGAKWLLTSACIKAGNWEQADLLLMEFPEDDNETLNHYFDCIMDIHEGGIDKDYIEEIKEDGRLLNPHVAKLLKTGKNPGAFPRKLLLLPGSEDEAKLAYWLIYGMPGIEKLS